jgi:hypothetical protein
MGAERPAESMARVEELNQSLNLCALGEGENILYVDAQIANVLSIFLWPSTI